MRGVRWWFVTGRTRYGKTLHAFPFYTMAAERTWCGVAGPRLPTKSKVFTGTTVRQRVTCGRCFQRLAWVERQEAGRI